MTARISVLVVMIFSLAACAVPSKRGVSLQQKNYSQLSGWSEAAAKPGMQAFRKTCGALNSRKVQENKLFSANKRIWQEKCVAARSAASSKQFFENNFTPYLVTFNGSDKGTFTGYFEKEIEASFTKNSTYKYPIYSVPSNPADMNLTRRQIENGALNGKKLEIAYAKSAARLFFLQIQGSGILKLPDGKRVQVGFAGKNTAEYTGIGSYMLREGLIKKGSAEDIVDWLERNPVRGRSIMNMNDRFVYFSFKQGGPYGSLGVELTGMGSLAVDPAYIPLGVPLWLQTTLPGGQRLNRLMNAQDTGSAIKGAIRGDVFFGRGDWAQHTASGMKNQGSYFMLVPKGVNAHNYF